MVKPAKYRGWHKTKSEQRRFSHTKFNSQFGLFFLSSTKRQFEHFKKVDFMKSLEFIMMLQSTIYSVSRLVVQISVKPFCFSIPKFQNRLPQNWLNQISNKNYLTHSIVCRMLNNFCLEFGSANLELACSETLTENLHDQS